MPNSPGKQNPKQIRKGYAMALHLKQGFSINHRFNFEELDPNCYEPGIPGPVPLAEIDYPSNIFYMFRTGSPQILVEGKKENEYINEQLWTPRPHRQKRFWQSGDLILLRYFADPEYSIEDHVIVQCIIDDKPGAWDAVEFRSPVRLKDSSFIIFVLGKLPNFQMF